MSDTADSSTRYFKLGVFMLAGVALLVTAIILLGAGVLFHKTIAAETLVYDSVNGLEVGSAVKYRGVPIGKVVAVSFASSKYPDADREPLKASGNRQVRGILIEMKLDQKTFVGKSRQQIVDEGKRLVESGLRARVTPAGISGQSYVDCDILNPAEHPAPPISFSPDEFYVPSAPSSFGQVLDAAGQIATDLQKANLGKMVSHIDDLTVQATAAVIEIKQVVANNKSNLQKTFTELPETAVHLRSTSARVDEIVKDPRINKVMSDLSGLGDSSKAAIADVRRLAHELSELLAGESDDLRSIITDLRRLAADGAATVEDARANPSRALFGKPPSKSSLPDNR